MIITLELVNRGMPKFLSLMKTYSLSALFALLPFNAANVMTAPLNVLNSDAATCITKRHR